MSTETAETKSQLECSTSSVDSDGSNDGPLESCSSYEPDEMDHKSDSKSSSLRREDSLLCKQDIDMLLF